MVVEHMLPAMLPGMLVALHYVIQLSRPRFGYASDRNGRRTPWIIAGMTILGVGGILAACATAWMGSNAPAGITLAVFAFILIGIGVGAAGTSMLALLAVEVPAEKRAAAGAVVWIMMIVGFVVTAGIAGAYLDPFSGTRLILVTSIVAAIAWTVSSCALLRLEKGRGEQNGGKDEPEVGHARESFSSSLADVWADPAARQFTVFVFVSMLAYSTQDLLLEPFAGTVFGMSPGETTQLTSMQNAGVLIGMVLIALFATRFAHRSIGALRVWIVAGCLGSAVALTGLVAAAHFGPPWPVTGSVIALGVANGIFAVAAVGSMMTLAGAGPKAREGVRMGTWGAAQAIAFALGGFAGTALYDVLNAALQSSAHAYAWVFAAEAVVFIVAARLALGIAQLGAAPSLGSNSKHLKIGHSQDAFRTL